ncbi:unnamed protein product [Soboliphyme baturini]|uniref:HMG box domain-containing protein n=1 Tax=Soboliphyme baturini TaxID=241478 RepID=A0A183IVP0_9BILA|nr:unnamed protein product [Soboliphyme baturini]
MSSGKFEVVYFANKIYYGTFLESDPAVKPVVRDEVEDAVGLTRLQQKKLLRNIINYLSTYEASGNIFYKSFDFNAVSFDGLSAEVLREAYKKLRTNAFRNSSMVTEVPMLSAYLPKLDRKKSSTRQKRPKSAYILYVQKHYSKVLKKNPEVKATEVFALLGKKWKDLPPGKKAKYEQMSRDEKAQIEDDNHPAPNGGKWRPKSAIQLFRDAKRQKYSNKYNVTGSALSQLLNKKFKMLPDNKKEKWEKRSFALFKEYVSQHGRILDEAAPSTEQPNDSVANSQPACPTSGFLNNFQFLDNHVKIEKT